MQNNDNINEALFSFCKVQKKTPERGESGKFKPDANKEINAAFFAFAPKENRTKGKVI